MPIYSGLECKEIYFFMNLIKVARIIDLRRSLSLSEQTWKKHNHQLSLARVTHNSLQLIHPWPTNSWSIWNLEIFIFEEGGKPENPVKNPQSKGDNQQQTQPTYDTELGNQTWDTLVGGKHSAHCATPAP